MGDDVGLGDGVGLAAGGCVSVGAGVAPTCCAVADVAVGAGEDVGLLSRDSGVGSVQANMLDKTNMVNNICNARLLMI